MRSTNARLVRWALLGVIALSGVSCSGGQHSSADIPVQNPDLVAIGDVLYQANCAVCHGTDLRGTDKGPSHLSAVYRPGHHSDEAFLVAVRVGVRRHHWDFGNMAPIDGLEDDDINAIIAVVRENQRIEGFEP